MVPAHHGCVAPRPQEPRTQSTDLAKDVPSLTSRMKLLLRRKGTPYDKLQIEDSKWIGEDLLEFMQQHSVLSNRPIKRPRAQRRRARALTARGDRLHPRPPADEAIAGSKMN